MSIRGLWISARGLSIKRSAAGLPAIPFVRTEISSIFKSSIALRRALCYNIAR